MPPPLFAALSAGLSRRLRPGFSGNDSREDFAEEYVRELRGGYRRDFGGAFAEV